MTTPRMRTAEKVLEIIKVEDPGTEVTLHHIRRMIKAGAVPVTNCGRKKLVDADAIIARLAEGYELPESPEIIRVGQLRRVAL